MRIDHFESITTDALRQYMSSHDENEYLLVDVRQPNEYRQGHIPGAQLIPLNDLEEQLNSLPSDRDVLFYCRSGARSRAASIFAAGSSAEIEKIFNVEGGIVAWNGQTLSQFPRLEIFEGIQNSADLLLKAMDLEKGAWRFYRHALEIYGELPFASAIVGLEKVEFAHAEKIFKIWRSLSNSQTRFEDLFDSLEGTILEGGESLQSAVERLEDISDNPCLELLEMALNIELSAYDLYRTLANLVDAADARDSLLKIAQAEKEHMRVLAGAIRKC